MRDWKQAVIEAEVAARIGAGRHEQSSNLLELKRKNANFRGLVESGVKDSNIVGVEPAPAMRASRPSRE